MSKRRRRRTAPLNALAASEHHTGAATVWSLRILARFIAPGRLAATLANVDEESLVQLGLTSGDEKPSPAVLRERLRAALARHDRRPIGILKPLGANIEWIADALNLNAVEQRVLAFVVLAQTTPPLSTVADAAGSFLDSESAVRLVAAALAERLEIVRETLSAGGTLACSGLLRIDQQAPYPFSHKLDLLGGLRDALLQPQRDLPDMLSRFFRCAAPSTLTPQDYPHVKDSIALLCRYLDSTRTQRTAGVNVLVHGRPGTGKTELARLLARAVSGKLFEVSIEDESGEPIAGRDRFSAYRLCQSMLARQTGCLILFDEIEDVFSADGPVLRERDRCKAWVNRLLETNPVPAIWISNEINAIDPAHLRRFDYVLELRVPPRSVRKRILEKHLTNLAVRPAFIERMAAHPDLAPAQVERAARVVAHLGQDKPEPVESALAEVLGGTLEALGHSRRPPRAPAAPCAYDLALVNADRAPESIATGLHHHPHARLCLYGPPGTGKTAFAHHLTRSLDRPLLAKRASDLLACYVGQTEQHIADMFREAETEHAVLLLDEADSLLRTRSNAHQSWEVTQVNELLVQMESFDGIFIAATNLVDVLDPASLRRFDLKVRFDYLTSEQAEAVFTRVLTKSGAPMRPDTDTRRRLAALGTLTPGDFATVTRQAKALGEILDARWLIEGLEAECAVKSAHIGRGIGFAAAI